MIRLEVREAIKEIAREEGRTIKYKVFLFKFPEKRCPICGSEIAEICEGVATPDGLGEEGGYIGCPKCQDTLRNLRIIKMCDHIEKEARELGIKSISTSEPPTPSGWGAVRRVYEFTNDGVVYRRWSDSRGWDKPKKYKSLAELFLDWRIEPHEEIANLAKYIQYKKTGEKGITMTEAIFGSSISQPEY